MGGAALDMYISTLTFVEQVSFLWEINRESDNYWGLLQAHYFWEKWEKLTSSASHQAETDAGEGKDGTTPSDSQQSLFIVWEKLNLLKHNSNVNNSVEGK